MKIQYVKYCKTYNWRDQGSAVHPSRLCARKPSKVIQEGYFQENKDVQIVVLL